MFSFSAKKLTEKQIQDRRFVCCPWSNVEERARFSLEFTSGRFVFTYHANQSTFGFLQLNRCCQIIKATYFTEASTVTLLPSGCWYILPRCRINTLKKSFVPVVGLSNERTQYHDSVLLLWCCFYCHEVVIAWCCTYGSVIMCVALLAVRQIAPQGQ